ncbi:hypothetical protein Lal_00045066, partial [Lupinus albus]
EKLNSGKEKRVGGANYNIGLQNTENGVVTRFPPEPSGYLHIGHAKAALLNDYFAKTAPDGNGKLLVRFDDTNPSKEKQEFEDSILHDLELMDIKYVSVTHTSDYFKELYEIAEQMILDGNAYADDTDPRSRRTTARTVLPASDVTAPLRRRDEERTDLGRKHCIRARIIAFDSSNGSMRDPVIYRFPQLEGRRARSSPPNRLGLEHLPYLRFRLPRRRQSLEGCHPRAPNDRVCRPQRAIPLVHRQPQAPQGQPLGVLPVSTLSERSFPSESSPRLSTPVASAAGMILVCLPSAVSSVAPKHRHHGLDNYLGYQQAYARPVVPRYMAIEEKDAVTVTVTGGPEKSYKEDRPKHVKNPDVGTKQVTFGPKLLLDQADVAEFADNEEITLMSWGNAIVRGLDKSASPVKELNLELHLAGDFKTTSKKAADPENLVKAELWDFGYLITKDTLEKDDNLDDYLAETTAWKVDALVDASIADLKENDFIQLERKGYYRVDKALGQGPDAELSCSRSPQVVRRKREKRGIDQDHHELPTCSICHAVPFAVMIRSVDVSADADPPKE